MKEFVRKHCKNYHFLGSVAICLAVFIVMLSLKVDLQWFWLLLYAALILPFTPFISDPTQYFRCSPDATVVRQCASDRLCEPLL
jgi:hypothetical protein